ncbi:MAG: S53 family peptidase [Nocardioidaceae bacterium]
MFPAVAALVAFMLTPMTLTSAVADLTASGDSATSATSATYTLVTGDRVHVSTTPDGRPVVSLASSPGGATSIQVLSSGSHLYVLPNDAAGFIGRPLDLSLFDVSSLQPSSSSSQPTVTVDFTAGGSHRLPPGMAKKGAGTYTFASPAAFGHALASDWHALKNGGSPQQAFEGISRIALAGSSPQSQPPGKLYTLTVKAYDRLGHRATGDTGIVSNVDDTNLFLAGQSYYKGEFAFSVPAGHYSVASFISTAYPDHSLDFTFAVSPEVDVTHNMTVVLEARKGNRISVSTPRPTQAVQEVVNYQRNSQNGPSFSWSFTTFGPTPLYATPTQPVHVGQLFFYPYFRLGDSSGGLSDYVYDLEFPYAGTIPADLSEVVTSGQLATVDATYHSPVPGRAEYEGRVGFSSWQAMSVGASNELVAPMHRTEYVTALPDLYWLQEVAADEQSFGGFTQSYPVTYTGGQQVSTGWMAQPMVPGVEQEPQLGQSCPLCRSGDTLNVQLFPFTDDSGNFQTADSTGTESLTLYQDGVEVGQSAYGSATFPLSKDPATYKLVYDVTRNAPWWPTSTQTHTAWTFPSQERAPDQLPPGWTCGGKGGGGGGRGLQNASGGGGSSGCSFEPLLFTHYSTSAGPDDVVAAGGPATVDVTVDHQRGAAATPISDFSAQVSYDDGQTWSNVPASSIGGGVFRLSYEQPALDQTNGFASLRIQATDSAGSSIDQTITRAYPLAVTAPAQLPGQPGQVNQRACSTASAPPYTQCMAVVDTAAGTSTSSPSGYGPADIQSAYNLSPTAGAGRTVAIVDAYDDPNAEADLASYRAYYGLPACTTDNGCFRKVSQRGDTTSLPSPDPGWGLEISLDLEAVSAACPSCNILLVEADSSSLADLIPAVRTAAAMGADVISNSYGSRGEFSGEQTLERYYKDLRVPFVVASGDYGYGNGAILIGGVSYPAASKYAVAVGGTSLTPANNPRGWQETAWDGATSGCSAYIHKPGWQRDTLCSMRTVADVSAVADPETGLAVYDTFGYDGWLQVGGTSLSAPLVSSVYAMNSTGKTRYASSLYAHADGLYDVVGGSNGQCQGTYLCTALPGYDGPTGLGTPDGPGAF